jgi:UDP-N-acetylmuramoyl-L-alanine---L-glutamate ligase
MQDLVKSKFEGKKIVIAGFGREGRSTYRFLRKLIPTQPLVIADRNDAISRDLDLLNDSHIQIITGKEYLDSLDAFDIIFKTPGIASFALPKNLDQAKITSQTDLFLQLFGKQAIGITGTKGKSTTSSLAYHIIETSGRKTVFAGNIGIPLLDVTDKITPDTTIIMELSSHQLEYLSCSPHISILLNIFQEHLDHYNSYEDYQKAKFNIGKYQQSKDFFIYNQDNELIVKHISECIGCNHKAIPYSLYQTAGDGILYHDKKVILRMNGHEHLVYDDNLGHNLNGDHNLLNIMAAATACYLTGIEEPAITNAVRTFKSLEHRIEYVGKYHGIEFYNDSIATIPEACVEAIKTLKNVDTLILGGFDRGIEYGFLYPFLAGSKIRNLIFIGEAGKRMKKEFEETGMKGKSVFLAADYQEVVETGFRVTANGAICLLSPAAASYDMFKNFEERGKVFKQLVRTF